MNLMAKVRKHENEDLHEKVISLVSLISHEFSSLVGDDVINQDAGDHWSINKKYLGKFRLDDAGDCFALRVALKEDYSKSNKDEILEVFRGAVISFVTGRNLAFDDIKKEEFSLAMDRLMIMSEALGCLRSQNALIRIKGYFDKERLNKQKAANARNPEKHKILEIILNCAKLHSNKYRSFDRLFEAIEFECEKKIGEEIGKSSITWVPGNFTNAVHRMRKSHSDFEDELKMLLLTKHSDYGPNGL